MLFIFIHGFLGSGNNWTPAIHQINKLSKQLELPQNYFFNPDLLWHGHNSALLKTPSKTQSYLDCLCTDLESQLLKELSELQKQYNSPRIPSIAIGHSFGVRPLLRIFSKNPGLSDLIDLKALVVEDSSPVLSNNGFHSVHKILKQSPVPFPTRKAARQYFDQEYNSVMSGFLMSNIRPNNNAQHDWRFPRKTLLALLEESKREELWEEWSQIKAPLDIVQGGQSSFIESPVLEKALNLRKSANMPITQHTFPNAGHWIHADSLADFCDYLVKLLLKHSKA